MDWGDWSNAASVYQAVVVTIVGFWAYIRFRKERTHYPHIDFSVDCNIFKSPDEGKYVAEFLVNVKNKGFVQQRLKKILLTVRVLDSQITKLSTFGDSEKTLKFGKDSYKRLSLTNKILDNVDIVPKKYKPYVVEPGCEETIRYITPVQTSVKYMLIHARYFYPRHVKPKRTARCYQIRLLFYYCMKYINRFRSPGYPRRPRTTEKFIQVEPLKVQQRSTENVTVGQSRDIP
jgi:hypothetical protein